MKPEQVYSLLVEANPIPDWDALPDIGPRLHAVDTRSPTMQTQTLERTSHDSSRRPRRLLPALAAVVAVIVAGAALILITGDDNESAQAAREEAALATVQEFHSALNSGDLATIERLTEADEADMQMWAYNVVAVATHPRDVLGCEVVDQANSLFVEVSCTVRESDPVFTAAGVTEVVVPWQVLDDGRLQWLPIQTPGFSEALLATRDYLRAEYPTEYAQVCDPSQYSFGTINFNQGIALTPECAELIVPLSDEIAGWIQSGRP